MSDAARDFDIIRLDFEGDGVGPMWLSDPSDSERAYDATAIFPEVTGNVSALRVALSGDDDIISVTVYTASGDISAEDRLAVVSRFGVDNIEVDVDMDIVKAARKIAEVEE